MAFSSSVVAGAIATGQAIALPHGVSITAGRETSQVDGQGVVVPGMVFGVKLPGGSTTTVFIPYSEITNTGHVEALINQRVAAIQAITG